MKFLDFITPTGQKGNVGNPADMLKLVLGVVVTIGTLAIGQQIAKKIDAVLPANTSNIQPFFTEAKAVETKTGAVIV